MIRLLRSCEPEAYRTAHYLLRDEREAFAAAAQALLAIAARRDLPALTEEERQAAARQAAIRAALQIARERPASSP